MSDEPKTTKVYLMVECEVNGIMDDRDLQEVARGTVAKSIAKDSGNRVGEAYTFTWPIVQVLVYDPVILPANIKDMLWFHGVEGFMPEGHEDEDE